MVVLTRRAPDRNLYRFYALGIAPTLFGEWALWREWGRIGSPGTCRALLFASERAAEGAREKLIARKLRRGYVTKGEGD